MRYTKKILSGVEMRPQERVDTIRLAVGEIIHAKQWKKLIEIGEALVKKEKAGGTVPAVSKGKSKKK